MTRLILAAVVAFLAGGFLHWEADGFEIERGVPSAPSCPDCDCRSSASRKSRRTQARRRSSRSPRTLCSARRAR